MQNQSMDLQYANGTKKAPIVLKQAMVLNVFTKEWIQQDIALSGEQIVGVGVYDGVLEIDMKNKYIVPGFIDAHVHIESSMLTPCAFTNEIVKKGTTSIIADPHELANVAGIAGIQYVLNQYDQHPCRIFVMLPSCVPATPFEQNGATLLADDLRSLQEHPAVLGLGEMMNSEGVIHYDPIVWDKLNAFSNSNIDGHAPCLSGKALQAYRFAGIRSDHECSDQQEVIEKLRCGFTIMAREGSAAKNLDAVLQAIRECGCGYEHVIFCSDDKHIDDIHQDGHIDYHIRRAIQSGVPIIEAYCMASYYCAKHFQLHHLGAIAPGYQADFVILNDIKTVEIQDVYCRGASYQTYQPFHMRLPNSLRNTIHIPNITKAMLSFPCDSITSVMELVPQQLLTYHRLEEVSRFNGFFIADETYQKIAVIERHKASGNIGLGIVKGWHIHGAIASSVAHDSHNVIVLGDQDEDMLIAIQALQASGGGYVIVQNETILYQIDLPVCGLLSETSADHLEQQLRIMKKHYTAIGIPSGYDPFQTLSFLALPVIPELRITDQGLFDVVHFQFLPQNEKKRVD